jgi:2-oxoisovalerate dehydrogenase E1 component
MSSGRLRMPIVLRGCIGVGGAAATHHSGSYYPLFAHLPGFRVCLPSTPHDVKGLLKTSIRSDDPVIFMEHKSLLNTRGPVPEEEYTIPFGEASIRRRGEHATVVALTTMVGRTLEVAAGLEAEGISLEVIDPRTVAPLDIDAVLESVHKTGRLLIADETWAPCGIGAEIAAQVIDRGFDDLDAPIRRLNGAHTNIPYSAPLEAAVVPQKGDIRDAVRELVAE